MKTTNKKPRITPVEQSARFKETARQLGADERPEAFEKVIKDLAPKKSVSKKP